jgi:hypothetical protein
MRIHERVFHFQVASVRLASVTELNQDFAGVTTTHGLIQHSTEALSHIQNENVTWLTKEIVR